MIRIILFSFAFLLFPIGSSFGIYQTELGDDIFIFVQSTVRNSDGTLVVYLESSKFTDLNKLALGSFLDSEASSTDPIIMINGQNYQVIHRIQSHSFSSDGLVASIILSETIDEKSTTLARFAHDGYPVVSGDTMDSVWTFVRPVS